MKALSRYGESARGIIWQIISGLVARGVRLRSYIDSSMNLSLLPFSEDTLKTSSYLLTSSILTKYQYYVKSKTVFLNKGSQTKREEVVQFCLISILHSISCDHLKHEVSFFALHEGQVMLYHHDVKMSIYSLRCCDPQLHFAFDVVDTDPHEIYHDQVREQIWVETR